jgi:cell division protein YceG involved in septum cleavage
MKALKIILIVVVALVVVQLALTGINILQKGGAYKGQSMEQILGVTPGKATEKDIEKLDKAVLFQLFYAAPAPQYE